MDEANWKDLAERLKTLFADPECKPKSQTLYEAVTNEPTANIALAMEELNEDQAACLFESLDASRSAEVLSMVSPDMVEGLVKAKTPEEIAELVKDLSPRDAASVVSETSKQQIRNFIKSDLGDISTVRDVETRLNYRKGTAGRLMTTQYIKIYKGIRVQDALSVIKHTDKKVDIPEDLYVVERDVTSKPTRNRLVGAISIRDLVMQDNKKLIEDVMASDVISVNCNASEDDAAALIAKYKFMSLPVTDNDGYLLGVIPADDLMQMLVARLRRLYTQTVGTDAQIMEQLTPFQAAKKRVPWLLGTMVIELCAGMVISHFDGILQKVILLASFMPVISAISGNVGLQAAAITVRAVDMGNSKAHDIWHSVKKEGMTSLLMAIVCGLVLGIIGGIWSKHFPFGLVIGGALTCSMLTAGLMGTIIPIMSKRLGFDPATTAGPFETAFQDVVGFAVFLWLASLLQNFIT
jgi:magnesium transporter